VDSGGDDGSGDSAGGSGEADTPTDTQPEPEPDSEPEPDEPAAETQTCGSCGYTLHTASDFELRPKWRITGDTVEIASDWRGTSAQGMEHNLWVFVVPEGGGIYMGDQVFERKWEGGFVSGSGGTPWYTVDVALDPGASYTVEAIAVPTSQGDSYWTQGEVPESPAFTY